MGPPLIPQPEPMFTTLPPFSIMRGRRYLETSQVPLRLTSMERSQSFSSRSTAFFRRITPAQFTRAWMLRNFPFRAPPRARQSSLEVTLQGIKKARSPISRAAFSPFSRSRSTSTTEAPAWCRKEATPWPIPEAAPVTTTTLPKSPKSSTKSIFFPPCLTIPPAPELTSSSGTFEITPAPQSRRRRWEFPLP